VENVDSPVDRVCVYAYMGCTNSEWKFVESEIFRKYVAQEKQRSGVCAKKQIFQEISAESLWLLKIFVIL